MSARVHPTAVVERNVQLGDETSVWDNVHIRHDTVLGEQCIVGGKTLIAYDVKIGNRVKINSAVYICNGVTIEDGVMVSAGTIFTNDRFPRATTPDLKQLRSSDPDEHTLPTVVREGATIGAGCLIGCNLELGRFSMIGMGSVVTRSVPDFCLAVGSPAKVVGVVCRCGEPIHRYPPSAVRENAPETTSEACASDSVCECVCHCGRRYSVRGHYVVEHLDAVAGELAAACSH